MSTEHRAPAGADPYALVYVVVLGPATLGFAMLAYLTLGWAGVLGAPVAMAAVLAAGVALA
jgi:hypothetical protein